MKLIIENWKTFLEQEEKKVNIYFSGKCNNCAPDKVRKIHNKLLSKWEIKNGKLLIRSRKDFSRYEGPLKKIIGFSAGARAAIKLKEAHPEAKLVLIDPWLPEGYIIPSNVEYYGTSCYIFRGVNKRRLKKSGRTCNPKAKSFQSHMKYFEDYFAL
tara:strand:- start:1782 stop:2249 length:468 start_codon:yes stop_codon:yes gene_type:complete